MMITRLFRFKQPIQQHPSWILLCLFACGLSLNKPSLAAGPPRLAVLILSGQNNHDWRATTPVLKQILDSSGRFTADVTEHPEQCTADSLAHYDLILSNWNAWGNAAVKEWPDATRTAMLDFVRNGKGLVSVHAGSSSFYDWREYHQMVGAAWNLASTGHGRPHPFYVRVTDPAQPITHGLRIFMTRDELWHRTGVEAGAHALACAFSDKDSGGTGQDEPVVFTNEFGKGRVFNMVLGHDVQAMAASGFQALLRRGSEWAATGQVTQPAGDLSLKPDELDLVLGTVRSFHPGDRRDALWMLEYSIGCLANTPQAAPTAERLAAFVLDPGATLDSRRFVCQQLSLIASGPQVPALTRLLADKDMSTHARLALERMPGSDALAALRAAAEPAVGLDLVGFVNSLGARRDSKAIPIFARALSSTDPAIAAAGIAALGELGMPGALTVLTEHESSVPEGQRTAFDRAMLRCADRLASGPKPEKAKSLYERLVVSSMPAAIRSAAFAGLVACDPAGGDALLKALRGDDKVIRASAARVLASGATARLVRAAAHELDSLPADTQVRVLGILQVQGDNSELPSIVRAAGSQDAGVRQAALAALGVLGGASDVPILARAAGSEDAADRDVAARSLVELQGVGVDAAIISAARPAPAEGRRELIHALVERSARSCVPSLLSLAAAQPEARMDALSAVGSLGDLTASPSLLRMLAKSSDENRPPIESALVGICSRSHTTKPIRDALPGSTGPYRTSLVTVLGTVGGPEALAPLRDAAKSTDPELQAAGLRGLASWPNAEPLDDLVTVATTTRDAKSKTLALRGIAQLAPLATDRPPAGVVQQLQQALTIADRPDEKGALLSAIGKVPCLEALNAAAAHLEDEGQSDQAALAAVTVADSVWREHPTEVGAIVRQLAATGSATVRERAANVLFKLSRADNLAIGGIATKPDGHNIDGESQGVQAAIDGDPNTYWDEDDNQSLYILRVQLKIPAIVSVIRIMGWKQENFAPKDFEILCDDKVVKKVENARYQNNLLTVTFPPTHCGALELRITGYYGGSPAIRELEIYRHLPGETK